MSYLFHFLTDMAINPKKQEMFEKDPEAIIEALELNEINKMGFRSGDRASVTAAFADDLPTNEFVAVMGGCFYTDPGPDPLPDPDPQPEPPEED